MKLTPRQHELLIQMNTDCAEWIKDPKRRTPITLSAETIGMNVKTAYSYANTLRAWGLLNASAKALTKKGLAYVEKHKKKPRKQ